MLLVWGWGWPGAFCVLWFVVQSRAALAVTAVECGMAWFEVLSAGPRFAGYLSDLALSKISFDL